MAANATKNSRYLSTAQTIQHAVRAALTSRAQLGLPAGTDDQTGESMSCVDGPHANSYGRQAAQHGLLYHSGSLPTDPPAGG